MRRLAALACVMALAFPCRAQEPPASIIRQFDIPTLEKLGRDMYEQDQAAWHATDALAKLRSRDQLAKEGIRGWIVVNRPQGPLVRFVRLGDSGPEAAYDIGDPLGRPVVVASSDPHLTDEEKAMFAVRMHAIASIRRNCAESYNTVVLKDPEGDGWLAWALASTTNPDLVVMLGHRRLTVSADGSKVLRSDALSNTCGAESIKEKDGYQVKMIVMTQLVARLPVETYVFLSLQHPLPFLVMTAKDEMWRVQNGTISKFDMSSGSQKP